VRDPALKEQVTEAHVAVALRRVVSEMPISDFTRKMGVTGQSFFRWKERS